MKRTILATAMAMFSAIGMATPAEAAPEAEVIRFPTGQACAVLSLTETRCFDSEAEMEAATATSNTDSLGLMASGYCAGRSDLWLYLYEHSNYGGRVLKFRDAGIWQNLTWWDFNDKMSSYRNTTLCTVYVAEHIDGAGAWLTIGALTNSSYVGASWDNRASSFFING